jgi:3-phenylpropionate/cinnamic acid dioxygenase small subunit
MSHDLWHEVQDFLFQEARLIDERRLEEWLDLFTEDATYWMPIRTRQWRSGNSQEFSERGELAYFDEDKSSLAMRVARLGTGSAWAEDPPSRTRHVISNVEMEATSVESEFCVRSAFVIYRTSLEHDVELFVGSREDVLRKAGAAWQIAQRNIFLDQTVLNAKNLSTFF